MSRWRRYLVGIVHVMTMEVQVEVCPLCGSDDVGGHDSGEYPPRPFHRCHVCDLIFVPAEYHIPTDEERARYLEHNNDPEDPGYISYQRGFIDWTVTQLGGVIGDHTVLGGMDILDVGCGPEPVLAGILRDGGQEAVAWDLHFSGEDGRWSRREPEPGGHDLVFAMEVVEHFRRPREMWWWLSGLVRPGGHLAVMTKLHDHATEPFHRWRYAMDQTHVAYHGGQTIDWLSSPSGPGLEIVVTDILHRHLFRRV